MPSYLVVFGIVALLLVFRMYRRMRPQPVRPQATFTYLAVIVVLTLFGLAGAERLLLTPLGLGLIPVMLVLGVLLGFALIRTMRFYTGPDGRLWTQGGILYVAIFVGLLVLRLGVSYIATSGTHVAPGANEPVTPLGIVSAALLFLSVGLWGARAFLLWSRSKEHDAHAPSGPSGPMPEAKGQQPPA